jgi:hypothetical protein
MNVIRSILISLFRRRSVKPSSRIPQGAAIPVAVRTVSGLPRARIRRVKRSRIAAIIDAWLRTRVNTDEVEFLRGRLSVYQATTPRDLTAPIPQMEISDAGVLIVQDTDRRHPIDRIFDGPSDETLTPEAQFQRASAEVVGRSLADTAGALDADLQFVDRQLREVDAQLDRLASEGRSAGVARTHLVESGRVDLAPPQIPSARSILFMRGGEALTLLAEGLLHFLRYLTGRASIRPRWRRNGQEVPRWQSSVVRSRRSSQPVPPSSSPSEPWKCSRRRSRTSLPRCALPASGVPGSR